MGTRASAVLAATLVLLSTGCGSDAGGTSVPPGTPTSGVSGQEVPSAPGPANGEPATEDPNGIEPPATGKTGVALKLGGGGGPAPVVPGMQRARWCKLAQWEGLSAPGVQLEIQSVSLVGGQAQLLAGGCSQAPPCEGAVISAAGQDCALLFEGAALSFAEFKFELTGELSCPDQATCDALEADRALQPTEPRAKLVIVPTGPPDIGGPDPGGPGDGVVDGDDDGDGGEDDGGETSGSGSPSPTP